MPDHGSLGRDDLRVVRGESVVAAFARSKNVEQRSGNATHAFGFRLKRGHFLPRFFVSFSVI